MFKIFIRDLADDPFDEISYWEVDRDFFLQDFIIIPESNGVTVVVRDSGFGQYWAFGITADILDSKEKRSKLTADMNIPDVAFIEHIDEGIEGWVRIKENKRLGKLEDVFFKGRTNEV